MPRPNGRYSCCVLRRAYIIWRKEGALQLKTAVFLRENQILGVNSIKSLDFSSDN
jgi:hypothetical protein